MTDHDQIQELLARRAELLPEEERTVREHLQACPECRTAAEAYERQPLLMRAMTNAPVPPALRAGVMAAVDARPALPWWRRLPPALIAFPAAAAVMVVITALAYMHRPQTQPNSALSTHPPTTATVRATPVRPLPTHTASNSHQHHPTPHRTGVAHRGHSSGSRSAPTSVPSSGPPGGSVALGPPTSSGQPTYPQPSGSSGVASTLPTAVPTQVSAIPFGTSAQGPDGRASTPTTGQGDGNSAPTGVSSPEPTVEPGTGGQQNPPTVIRATAPRSTPTSEPTVLPVATAAVAAITPGPVQSVFAATPAATEPPPPLPTGTPTPTSTPTP